MENEIKKSDIKVIRAIKATSEFLAKSKNKDMFTDYGLTIFGCEVRNLEEYNLMVGKDKRTLSGHSRELYRAI